MQYNKIAGGFASFPPPMIQGLSSAQQPQMVAPVAPGGAAPANALGGLAPGQSMPQPQTAAQQMPAQTMGVGGFGEPFGAAPAAPAPRLSGGDAWPPRPPRIWRDISRCSSATTRTATARERRRDCPAPHGA